MSAKKQGSSGWLVVLVGALALWLGLRSGNGASQARSAVERSPVQVAPQPAVHEPTLEEVFAALDPERRFAQARDFAALGLRSPQERPEAYTVALKLLDGFPSEHTSAKQAKALRTEVLARQALPAADKRAPTEAQLRAFLVRLGTARGVSAPSQGVVASKSAPASAAAAAAPRADAAPKPPSASSVVGSTPGCAENGSCYGDISATTGRPKTVEVHGYYRKNGTYVRGHYRSK